MVFLKIEMRNHYYNLFISSCYNTYFLKFMNENVLELNQYLFSPTEIKQTIKNLRFSVYLKTAQYL